MDNAEEFWGEQARAVDWFERPRQVLDPSAAPGRRWFPGATLNLCYNALDRHVIRGRSDEPALIFHSAVTGERRSYSYAELLERVAQLAGGLRELGVSVGDRVVIYLPLVAEAAMAMLACARIGAVHVVVAGGTGPQTLAGLIDDVVPKVIISASCGLAGEQVVPYKPLLDEALELAVHRPDYCVIWQRPQLTADLQAGRDLDFAILMRPGAFQPGAAAEVAADAPGRYAVALTYAMRAVFGVGPGQVTFTAGDLGSATGQSCIVYGPLLVGAATVVFEGEPEAGTVAAMVAEHGIEITIDDPSEIAPYLDEESDLFGSGRRE